LGEEVDVARAEVKSGEGKSGRGESGKGKSGKGKSDMGESSTAKSGKGKSGKGKSSEDGVKNGRRCVPLLSKVRLLALYIKIKSNFTSIRLRSYVSFGLP
jgi:hypothetical protein